MKFILVGVVLVGMGYIGFGFARFYRRRKRFFADLILFCEKLCVDISFSKETLKTIVSSNLTNFSKDFKNVLERYLDFLSLKSSEVTPNLLFKGSTLLSKEEQENIALFFKSLGRLDVSCQVVDINNFKNKFLNFQSNADEENKKFGSLSLKLMLLFGALVVIILI
jgi:stage III sporulation protein AB